MELYWLALITLIALVGTALATPLSIKLAWRIGAIDYPDGRRVNTKPTPRLGGLAVFVGIVLSLGFIAILNWINPEILNLYGLNTNINYLGVAVAVTVVFAVGFLDDVYQIGPYIKLLGQIAAAIIACASGVLFTHFLNPLGSGTVSIGFMAYPVTIFYLVAFASIINLIDGLDGLASGIVAICAATLFVLSFSRGNMDAAIVALAIAGACGGFLFFNFYPAKVFLGDSGSLVLGFSLGLVSLFGVVRATALIALLIPVIIAGIPVIDTFSAIVRRLRSKTPVFGADKAHVHHRFINLGFSQRTTVLIIYGLSIALSVLAILITQDRSYMRLVYAALLIVVVGILIWRLGLLSTILTHHYERRTKRTKLAHPQDEQKDEQSNIQEASQNEDSTSP